jgi:hypothetical protein
MAKEPKDPAFPHPALETGVPHYPTPNVPDFYTRDGHILLVEKISTDKGSYNPKPLDGSVTYSGKDARKWPSELYLVAERPTADGMFAYRFWANDRTMASQDPWNYGVSYSDNDPEYPVYARQYIVPRSQYTPIAKGEKDPIFGGNAIVAQQQMQELDDDNPLRSRYVQMVVQYESIPGPVVVGKQINQRGDLETVEVQTVAAGTAPDADSFLIISSSVEPVDSIKSKRKKSSVTTYTTLTSKEKKSGILGITTSTDDVVDPSTEPDSLSATVLQSSVQQISKTKARKVTTSIDNTITLEGGKRNSRGDKETTIKSIVSPQEQPSAESYLLQGSQIEPIDSFKSQKVDVVVDQYSELSGNSFQMGGGVGAAGGAKTKITNQIVDPSTYTTPTPTVSTLSYEEKPISTTKIEVVTESLVDKEFPKIKSSDIDPVSHTGVYSSFSQIVDASSENKASASFGLVKEYADLDKWHSQLTQKDYRSLVGLTWTEHENESYAPPARLYVFNMNWGGGNWTLQNIISYQRPQPKTVTATVTYTIRNAATTMGCFNPITQTLITDLGTFTNVIHNVFNYQANGILTNAPASIPSSAVLPSEITYRFSSTRIPRMGGLYLEKVVTIPFYSLYSNSPAI